MKRWLGLCLLAGALALTVPSEAWANVHGVFRVVKGQVQVKSGKTGKTARAKIGQKVFPKDTIITGKDSRAKIVMVDKNVINVSPDSNIEIENYEFEPSKGKKNVLLNVIYGKVRSKVNQKYDGKEAKFQVKTKSAVAGVRGTDFLAGFNRQTQQSQVVTFEGNVSFGQPGPGGTIVNPVSVGVGQMADVAGNGPPSPPKSVPKQMLANMDKESNADKAPGPGSSDKREPAGNNKEGEKKKGDGDKKQDGGGDKGAKKDNGGGDKKQDGGDKGKNDQGKGGEKGNSQQAKDGNKTSRDTDKANNGKSGGDNKGANNGSGGGPKADKGGSAPGPGGSASGDKAGGDKPAPGGDRQPASVGGSEGGDGGSKPIAGGDPQGGAQSGPAPGMAPPPPVQPTFEPPPIVDVPEPIIPEVVIPRAAEDAVVNSKANVQIIINGN